MSHGDLEDKKGAEEWVKENAREFLAFAAQYPLSVQRGALQIWLNRCFKEYGWPLQVLKAREVVRIFYQELQDAQTKH